MYNRIGKPLMTKKVEEIINRAFKDLDRFYKDYGEDEEPKKTTPKKSVTKEPPSKTVVNRPIYTTTYKAMIPKPPKKLSLNIKGLSSREIVDLIKKETGESITVSLKSKQNIIRHAKIILKKKGIKLYG
jgi:hypothetical protein